MKKEINSKSRRKWIMGGLAAFASVALLTTGFAVWVVGSAKTENKNDVTVKVDTAANESISFEMKLTANTLKLEESTTTAAANAKDKPLVNVRANTAEFVATPLTLTASYTIKYGKAYNFDFNKVAFEIVTSGGEGETATAWNNKYVTNLVKSENIKMGTTKLDGQETAVTSAFARTTTENLTYFDAPKAMAFADQVADGNNFKRTGTLNLAFTWGSFFGKKESPATYYNAWATEKGISSVSTDVTDALTEEVTQEMNAMHTQLDGKTIQLRAYLTKESSKE